MKILLGYCLSYGYLILLICFAEVSKRLFKIKSELTRKLIHIFVCFACIIMYNFFGSTIHTVIVSFSFVIINYISAKFNLISSMELNDKSKKNYGTVYYALSLTILNMFALFRPQFALCVGMGMFALSFGDGFACVVGQNIKKGNFYIINNKSFWGSVSCILFSVIGLYIFKAFTNIDFTFFDALVISAATGILELLSGNWDNISVPLAVMLLSGIMCN